MADQNQSKSPLGQEAPARRPASGVSPGGGGEPTTISSDTIFEGKIIAKGELRIDGTFKGEVTSSDRILVGASGKVDATIETKVMIISGQVVGNLKILERLEMQSSGELHGDLEIQPGCLILEQGARLEGRCTMGLTGSKPAAGAPTAGAPAAPVPQPPAAQKKV